MMLKLPEHIGITISLLYKQKNWWNFDIQNFIAKFWIFAYFTQTIAIQLNFRVRHVFMTS